MLLPAGGWGLPPPPASGGNRDRRADLDSNAKAGRIPVTNPVFKRCGEVVKVLPTPPRRFGACSPPRIQGFQVRSERPRLRMITVPIGSSLGKPTPSSRVEDDPQCQPAGRHDFRDINECILTCSRRWNPTNLQACSKLRDILQIQVAYAPDNPVNSDPRQYTILSSVAGLILAVVVVLLWEYLRQNASRLEGTLVVAPQKIVDKKPG